MMGAPALWEKQGFVWDTSKQLFCVLFAPVSLIALFLRIKFKWNHSMLVSEEECDVAGHEVCCVSERSLGAVRMRMKFQRHLLLVGMAKHPGFAVGPGL